MTDLDDDDDLAIRTIVGEAAREPILGQLGVAQVIKNRIRDGSYGKTAGEVVLAPKQFTPWSTRASELLAIRPDNPAYQQAALAWQAVKGGTVPDVTGGALNFANPGDSDPVNQRGWIADMMRSGTAKRIGNHVFGTAPGRPGARAVASTGLPDDLEPVAGLPDDLEPVAAPKQADLVPPAPPSQWDHVKRAVSAIWEDPRRLSQLGMVQAVKGAVTAPGDVASGALPVPQSFGPDTPAAQAEPVIQRAFDLGTLATPAPPARITTQGLQAVPRAEQASWLPGGQGAAEVVAASRVPEGYVRFYHGGEGPQAGGPRWATTDPEYARSFRAGDRPNKVSYVDIPKGSPAEIAARAWDDMDAGTNMVGRYKHIELPEEWAARLRPIGAEIASPGQTVAPGQLVAQAANRLEVPVPRVVASDSMLMQRAGQAAKQVPFAGDPLIKAAEATRAGLGEVAERAATELGRGAARNMEQSGAAAKEALTDWIGAGSSAVSKRLYDQVDELVNPETAIALDATKRVVDEIKARRANAHIAGDSRAVAEVRPATKVEELPPITMDGKEVPAALAERIRKALGEPTSAEPITMNYQGIKDLRSHIGEQFNRPPEGMSRTELERIYGALSEDLRSSVQAAGGEQALSAFERANRVHSKIEARRKGLAKIVGKQGDASPAQIFDSLTALAGSTSRADITKLSHARRAMGSEAWEQFTSGVVGRLGRDAEGNFSPDRFLTAYGKISPEGKAMLFNSTGRTELRQALDDIATVSGRSKQLAKFGNPSGTAQNVGFMASGAALLADPVTTLTALAGGNIAARILASPVTAKPVAQLAKAAERAATKPSPMADKAMTKAAEAVSRTVAAQFGIMIPANDLIRAPRGAAAEDERQPLEFTVNAKRR
jgi:hypothetical protein